MNTGLAAERIDDQTRIVGECRGLPLARAAASALMRALAAKVFAGLLRLGQTELAGGLRGDAVRREQIRAFL